MSRGRDAEARRTEDCQANCLLGEPVPSEVKQMTLQDNSGVNSRRLTEKLTSGEMRRLFTHVITRYLIISEILEDTEMCASCMQDINNIQHGSRSDKDKRGLRYA